MNGPGGERCRRTHPKCICPDCVNDAPGFGIRCCWEAGRGERPDRRLWREKEGERVAAVGENQACSQAQILPGTATGRERQGMECTVIHCPGFEAKEKGDTHADQSQGTAIVQ